MAKCKSYGKLKDTSLSALGVGGIAAGFALVPDAVGALGLVKGVVLIAAGVAVFALKYYLR